MRAPFVFIEPAFSPVPPDRLSYLGHTSAHGLPDRHRCLTEWVVARKLLPGQTALDSLLHALGQLAVLHQVQIKLLYVAEVKEVALPLDLGCPVHLGKPEPAAPDAVDLSLGAVGIVVYADNLLPESDDLADLVVD